MTPLDYFEKQNEIDTIEHFKERRLKSILSQAWFHNERQENIVLLLRHRSLGYPSPRNIYRKCTHQESPITSVLTNSEVPSASAERISFHDNASNNDFGAAAAKPVATALSNAPHHHQCSLLDSGGCAALKSVVKLLKDSFSEPQPDPRNFVSISDAGHDAYVKASYKLVNCSEDQNYHLLGMKIKETLQLRDYAVKDLGGKYRLNHLLSKSLESAKQQRRVLQAKAEERMLRTSPLFSDSVKGISDLARAAFLITCSSDGKLLASCHGDRSVRVSCCLTGKCLRTLKGHRRTTWAVAFHPKDNNKIATGCLGGEVRVWYKEHLLAMWLSPLRSVFSLSFHPFEDTLAIGCGSALFLLDNFTYQTAEPRTLFSQTVKESVRFVRFSPCGKFLLTAITNPEELGSISNLDLPMPGKSQQTEIVGQACNCGCSAASAVAESCPSPIPPAAVAHESSSSGLSSTDPCGSSTFDGRFCGQPTTADNQGSSRKLNTLRPVLSSCRLPHMFCAVNPFIKLLWSDKLLEDWMGLSSFELKAALELILNQDRPSQGVSNLNFFRSINDEFPLNQVHSGYVYSRHFDRRLARILSSTQNVDDEATLMMMTQVVEEDVVRRGLLHHSLGQFDICWPSLDDELREFTAKKCCISDTLGECQWLEITTAESICYMMQPVKDSCFNDRNKCRHRRQPCNILLSNISQAAANASNICETTVKSSNLSQAVTKSSNISKTAVNLSYISQAAPQNDIFSLFGRTGLEKMQLGLHRANIVLGQRSHWILAALHFSRNEEFGFSNTHQGMLCSDLADFLKSCPTLASLNMDQARISRVRERYANVLVGSFIPYLIGSVEGVRFFPVNTQTFENKFHWIQVDSAPSVASTPSISAPSAASTPSIFAMLSRALFQPKLVTAVPLLLSLDLAERHLRERSLLLESPIDSVDDESLRPSTLTSVEPFKPLLVPPLHGCQQEATNVQSPNHTPTDRHQSTSVPEFTQHHCCLLPSTQDYLNSIHKYTAEVRSVVGIEDEIDEGKYMPERIISWEPSRLDSFKFELCYWKTYAPKIPRRSASSDFQVTQDALYAGFGPQHSSNPHNQRQTVREGLCRIADLADEKLMTEMLTTLLSQEPYFDTQFSDVFQILPVSPIDVGYAVHRAYSFLDYPERSSGFRNSISMSYDSARERILWEVEELCSGDVSKTEKLLNTCHGFQSNSYQGNGPGLAECHFQTSLRRSPTWGKFLYERLDMFDRSTSESHVAGSSYYSDLVQAFLSCQVPGTTITGHEARLLAKHFYQIQRDFFNVFGYVKFSYVMAKDPLSILSWLGATPHDKLVFSRSVPISPLRGPVFPSFPPLPDDCINAHYLIPPGTDSEDFCLNAFPSMRNMPLGSFSRYLFLLPNVLANLNEIDMHLQTSFCLNLTNSDFVGLFDFLARGFQTLEFVRIVTYVLYGKSTPFADSCGAFISVIQSWLVQASDLITWVHRINILTRETKRAGLQQFLIPADKMDFLTTGLCADFALDRNVMRDIEKIITFEKKNTFLPKENISYMEKRLQMTDFKAFTVSSEGPSITSKKCDLTEEQLHRHAARHCQLVMQVAHDLYEKKQHEPYFLWHHTTPANRGLAARMHDMIKQLSHHVEDVSKEKLNPTLFPFILPRPNRNEREISEEWENNCNARSTLPKKPKTGREANDFPPPGFTCLSRFCTLGSVQPSRPAGCFWRTSEPQLGQPCLNTRAPTPASHTTRPQTEERIWWRQKSFNRQTHASEADATTSSNRNLRTLEEPPQPSLLLLEKFLASCEEPSPSDASLNLSSHGQPIHTTETNTYCSVLSPNVSQVASTQLFPVASSLPQLPLLGTNQSPDLSKLLFSNSMKSQCSNLSTLSSALDFSKLSSSNLLKKPSPNLTRLHSSDFSSTHKVNEESIQSCLQSSPQITSALEVKCSLEQCDDLVKLLPKTARSSGHDLPSEVSKAHLPSSLKASSSVKYNSLKDCSSEMSCSANYKFLEYDKSVPIPLSKLSNSANPKSLGDNSPLPNSSPPTSFEDCLPLPSSSPPTSLEDDPQLPTSSPPTSSKDDPPLPNSSPHTSSEDSHPLPISSPPTSIVDGPPLSISSPRTSLEDGPPLTPFSPEPLPLPSNDAGRLSSLRRRFLRPPSPWHLSFEGLTRQDAFDMADEDDFGDHGRQLDLNNNTIINLVRVPPPPVISPVIGSDLATSNLEVLEESNLEVLQPPAGHTVWKESCGKMLASVGTPVEPDLDDKSQETLLAAGVSGVEHGSKYGFLTNDSRKTLHTGCNIPDDSSKLLLPSGGPVLEGGSKDNEPMIVSASSSDNFEQVQENEYKWTIPPHILDDGSGLVNNFVKHSSAINSSKNTELLAPPHRSFVADHVDQADLLSSPPLFNEVSMDRHHETLLNLSGTGNDAAQCSDRGDNLSRLPRAAAETLAEKPSDKAKDERDDALVGEVVASLENDLRQMLCSASGSNVLRQQQPGETVKKSVHQPRVSGYLNTKDGGTYRIEQLGADAKNRNSLFCDGTMQRARRTTLRNNDAFNMSNNNHEIIQNQRRSSATENGNTEPNSEYLSSRPNNVEPVRSMQQTSHSAEQKKTSTTRVQLWPYDSNHLPDIADRCAHLVAPIGRIHNDSSLALTKDWGRIALLSPGMTSPNEDLLGVYSLLEGPTCARGTLLYSAEVSPKVISLSFSPSEAHLLLTCTGLSPEPLGVCQFLQLGTGGELSVLRVVPRFKHPLDLNIASVNCGVWQPTEGGAVVLSCNNGAVLLVRFK